MIEIVPFEFNHAISMGRLTEAFDGDPRALERVVSIAGAHGSRAITILDKKKPIAIFVGIIMWGFCCDIIAVVSEDIKKVKKGFVKACKKLITESLVELELGRLQITVKESCMTARRFAEVLGFEKEGILRFYGPEKVNHIVYGRVN